MTEKTYPADLPEDYISLDELRESVPNFYKKYMKIGTKDSPMMIWFDEDTDVYAEIFDVEIEQGEPDEKGNMPDEIEVTTMDIKKIEARKPFQISVRNFIHLFGDPAHGYWNTRKPKWQTGVQYVKDSRWSANRQIYLDRLRRNINMKEGIIATPLGDKEMPCKYKVGTYQPLNTNKEKPELELWGKMPKVYVMPPDSFKLTIPKQRDKTINDIAMEYITTKGLESKRKFSQKDLADAKAYLVKKGKLDEKSSLTMVRVILEESFKGDDSDIEEGSTEN